MQETLDFSSEIAYNVGYEVICMITGRVSDKGQITLPAQVRRRLGIAPRSRVQIVEGDNELIIRPVKNLSQLYGLLHEHVRGRKPKSWEQQRREMHKAVAREVSDE